jgi:hypothetical protein
MGSIVTPFQKWKEPQWQLQILQYLNNPGLESQWNSIPAFKIFDLGSAVN